MPAGRRRPNASSLLSPVRPPGPQRLPLGRPESWGATAGGGGGEGGLGGRTAGGSRPKRTWGYTFPPFPVGSRLGAMPPPAVLSTLALGSTGGPGTPGGGEPAGAGTGGPPDSAGGQPLQPATPSTGPVAGLGADGETAAGPFVLGEGIPPVPAKVVARIWKGEYIDMADLLRDNLEADRRRATAQRGAQQQGQAKATR